MWKDCLQYIVEASGLSIEVYMPSALQCSQMLLAICSANLEETDCCQLIC